ncbi:hypothetical protein PtA15_18A411 [Puccinia triticina]|uniref:Membrane anchor Opy2 N-terminal domain-containing protein n=1 Tax=Puccinia triticina TaxID=208348 RepID=A0ABY7D6P5_9BASI|nr:uncharacterized protein PtA15_18A411 [Puccinia triticina]WAQ93351.1 hypothetical protein PtA15_18A411 [Puccinia triticina]
MSSDCVPCNTAPPPCRCSADQTCVQTPRNCSTCPRNICISSAASSPANNPGSAGLAAPIGGAIGGLAAGLLIILSLWILYRRNMLPSCFTAIFESRSTKSFSKKHPHHLRNNNQKKNRFLQSNSHNLKSQNELPHQSVIYLPTDTRDPKTASIIESDDDPFSDKHSGVSIIGAQPKPSHSINPTVELLASPFHPSPPATYNPSRTLSLTGPEDRSPSSAEPPSSTSSTNLPSPAAEQHHRASSFFLTPGQPSPTHPTPTAQQHRPIRPHRAPDLDLRLPATAQVESDEANKKEPPGGAEPASNNSYLSPGQDTQQSSLRRLSGSSDATTHDSHLSSILDPAMIVTPVTLVRTASGRQAAVQRVALRGQEKARVVRLPPSGHPHGPSPLSLSNGTTSSTIRSPSANVRETFGFSPTTPGIGRARDTLDRPHSDLSALAATDETGQEEEQHDEGREDIGSLPSNSNNEHVGRKSSTNLRRARSTAAYSIASSSFGGSSVCDSFIEDEEVEFPTVLGRSAATLAQRILQQQHDQMQGAGTETAHHHVNLKALGRDRAISLSSIITEEARRTSRDGSPPPMPSLPACAGFIPSTPSAGGSPSGSLPEPFKPFAGQKPRRPSGQSGPAAGGSEGSPATSLDSAVGADERHFS